MEHHSTQEIAKDFVQAAQEINNLVQIIAAKGDMTYEEYKMHLEAINKKISKLSDDVQFANRNIFLDLCSLKLKLLQDYDIIEEQKKGSLIDFEETYRVTKLRKKLIEHYRDILLKLQKITKKFSKDHSLH